MASADARTCAHERTYRTVDPALAPSPPPDPMRARTPSRQPEKLGNTAARNAALRPARPWEFGHPLFLHSGTVSVDHCRRSCSAVTLGTSVALFETVWLRIIVVLQCRGDQGLDLLRRLDQVAVSATRSSFLRSTNSSSTWSPSVCCDAGPICPRPSPFGCTRSRTSRPRATAPERGGAGPRHPRGAPVPVARRCALAAARESRRARDRARRHRSGALRSTRAKGGARSRRGWGTLWRGRSRRTTVPAVRSASLRRVVRLAGRHNRSDCAQVPPRRSRVEPLSVPVVDAASMRAAQERGMPV